MRKKILIGSILVLTLLLLMPSIPAIQQKIVEEEVKQDLQEKLDSINLREIIDEYLSGGIKHPLLYSLVIVMLLTQCLRLGFWFAMAMSCCRVELWVIDPVYENFFYAFMFMLVGLSLRTTLWIGFWNYVSDIMGWNWEIGVN